MIRTSVIIFVALVTASANTSHATTWNISPDGSGDFPTIKLGVIWSAPGDTLLLACGTFFENDIDIGKPLSIHGATGTPDCVTVDGQGNDVFTLFPVADQVDGWEFSGITVTNATSYYGIHSRATDLPLRVSNCHITNCYYGIWGHDAVVEDCEIRDCTEEGFVGSRAQIRDCLFEGNDVSASLSETFEVENVVFRANRWGISAWGARSTPAVMSDCTFDQNGSGLYVSGTGQVDVLRSVFADNDFAQHHWSRGGAIYVSSGNVSVSDCRFEGNESFEGGAVYIRGVSTPAPSTFLSCTFVRNVAENGGALGYYGGTHVLDGCTLVENTATTHGGSIKASGMAEIAVAGCTFKGDSSPDGSVARLERSQLSIEQSIVAPAGPDPFFSIETILTTPSVTATCTDFYANDPGAINPMLGTLLSEGANFSADPVFCGTTSEDVSIAAFSFCAPAGNSCGMLIGSGPVNCVGTGVLVNTHSGSLEIHGDGVPKQSAALFDWNVGETHEVSVLTPQEPGTGVQYHFRDWDDGGNRTHSITVSQAGLAATANFDSLFHLEMAASTGGSVSPPTGFHTPGSTLEIAAIPDSGFVLALWRGEGPGSYDGVDDVTTVTLNRPLSQLAIFAPGTPVTVRTDPPGLMVLVDGEARVAPTSFWWQTDSVLDVAVETIQPGDPGARHSFVSWSDGGIYSHGVFIGPDPVELTARFAQEYALTFAPADSAALMPGDSWNVAGEAVTIEAIPEFGWELAAWTGTGPGSYSGPDNPAIVTMNGPIHEEATLQPAFDGQGYEFSISASDTDPFVHQSPPTGEFRALYLWATCLERGLSAFQASVTGSLAPTLFSPADGILNAGNHTDLLLAVGGCPTGPDTNVLLGTWLVDDVGGSICLEPTNAGAVDCDPIAPDVFYDPIVVGFTSTADAPCIVGTNECAPPTPTPILLSGLSAEVESRVVTLSWISALANDGFHVYRSSSVGGEYHRLTDAVIRSASPHSYRDTNVQAATTYFYRVGSVDLDGTEVLSDPVTATTAAWAILRTELELGRPNPFRAQTTIRFSIRAPGEASLRIYDVGGRLVRQVVRGDLPAGEHSAIWDGRDDSGLRVAGGTYFVRFNADGESRARKVVYLGR